MQGNPEVIAVKPSPAGHQKISIPFELKTLSESGEFTGIASPYGVLDLGKDIVDLGAFTKTITERGNKVRLLDGHECRIGIASVTDTPAALECAGKINLDKQAGRDAYSDLKFYQSNGQPMGLSIGYETVKAEFSEDGVRHLKEVRLWEISITEFPMNERALVQSVKSKEGIMDTTPTPTPERKAGRKISAASKESIKSACDHMKSASDLLLALIAEEAAEENDENDDSEDTSKHSAAKEAKSEPVDHSAISRLFDEAKETFLWNR